MYDIRTFTDNIISNGYATSLDKTDVFESKPFSPYLVFIPKMLISFLVVCEDVSASRTYQLLVRQ